MRRAIATVAFALGFAVSATAAAERPSADWRTIATPHFRVHFPAPFEAWAARAAASLEAAHGRIADYVGYAPDRPIDVLVSDPQADANGLAYPFLDRPRIELWTSAPDPESGLGDFRDWTEILVTHELAHVLHLTRPRNRPGLLERLVPLPIGPVLLNSPRWVAEGYATVVEGALTGSGRPSSSFRAMVLRRFALEGKLPSYGALDGTGGWLGGSMAYLVGSSYLEWLEAREGPGSLRRLWMRMASRRGGSFATAFRAVFGRSPADLYDRFRAEMTAAAIEQERRLEAEGIVAGEKWQRLEGGTASLEVSPDGTRLLARRSPRRGESWLAVWTLEPSKEERRAKERRAERDRRLAADPNEIVDKREAPEPRRPKWRLAAANGRAPEEPRWTPDGRSVLFTRREPASDGVLHRDLFLWTPETGDVRRATRLADVGDADPGAGGTAIAVRSRYGTSELVQVDLVSGGVRPLSAPAAGPDALWTHPRLSPDGSRVAVLLHRAGSWHLVILPAVGGEAREIASEAGVFGPPAWSADGRTIYAATDAAGRWELAAFDTAGAVGAGDAAPRPLTRVTGGAYGAAPAPDGKSLFCLELTAKGIDIARLPLGEEEKTLSAEARLPPILPPPSAADARPLELARSSVGPSRPYRASSTQVVRLFSGFTLGPDGESWEAGAEGNDVVGRFDWVAAAAFGNAAGPRGGSVAAAWLGLPVAVRAQIFSALERPGSQRLAPRPELDEERRGGALSASWAAERPWGRIAAEAWAGATRVEALAEGRTFADGSTFGRALGGGRARVDWRRLRGRSGVALAAEAGGEAGRTDGASWDLRWAAATAAGTLEGVRLSVSARAGRSGGSPTPFDLFAVGGASSSILPPALDRNRVDSPALPAAVQLGEKVEGFRAELSGSGFPLLLYAERWRAWSAGQERPAPIRLEGIETRVERLVPLDLPESLSLYAGIARVRSRTPRFDSVRGYAGLVYRP